EARAMIDDDAAFREAGNGGSGLVVCDHHDRRALRGVRCAAHAEAVRTHTVDQQLGELSVAGADVRDTDLVHDLLPAERSMHGRQCGRAQLEATGGVTELEITRIEVELVACAPPPRALRLKLADQAVAYVHVRQARPAHEPLER